MSANSYFYLPVDPEIKTSKDVMEFFNEIFASKNLNNPDHTELNTNAWGHDDNNTGMHRFEIKGGNGKSTEFMVLSEINDKVFELCGDNRDSWLRVRLGNPNAGFGQVMTGLAKDMDGWCAPDSKAFTRPSTGDSIYLLLGGELSKKEFSRTAMISMLNGLGDKAEKLDKSASDSELQRTVAKKLKLDSIIKENGDIIVPIRKPSPSLEQTSPSLS